jgi:hypothetical protein
MPLKRRADGRLQPVHPEENVRIGRSEALIAIVAANLVASVLHFGDNMINFHAYPEPTWIPSPHVVDALWFVMTPILFLGWWFSSRNAKWRAVSLFWLYGGLSMFVLGHYNFAAPSELSLRINVLICSEALAALILIGVAPFLVPRNEPGTHSATPSRN